MPISRRPVNCDYCAHAATCFMATALRDSGLEEAGIRRTGVQLGKRELLHGDGDPSGGLHVVCSGQIKVYKLSADGKPLITRMVGPGEVVDLSTLFSGSRHSNFAEATRPTVTARIPAQELRDRLSTNPKLAVPILAHLAAAVKQAEQQTLHVAYSTAADRLTDALWSAAVEEAGEPVVRHKRQELAELTGLTVETTVRTLKAFERDGLLHLDGPAIRLLRRPDAAAA